jgi:hypothetical protein
MVALSYRGLQYHAFWRFRAFDESAHLTHGHGSVSLTAGILAFADASFRVSLHRGTPKS